MQLPVGVCLRTADVRKSFGESACCRLLSSVTEQHTPQSTCDPHFRWYLGRRPIRGLRGLPAPESPCTWSTYEEARSQGGRSAPSGTHHQQQELATSMMLSRGALWRAEVWFSSRLRRVFRHRPWRTIVLLMITATTALQTTIFCVFVATSPQWYTFPQVLWR